MTRFKKIKNKYFPRRRLLTDWRYWKIKHLVSRELNKPFPGQQSEILELSKQYRQEHRYIREKLLIDHAVLHFPEWDYALERLAWHQRPVFHADLENSQVQPRAPVYRDRDESKIPRPGTLNSLCIVTGMSSNAPYWELGIQLIESLKATRFYQQTPIKILDCGLDPEHRAYLVERFQVEVKDPGWDIDPRYLVEDSCCQTFPRDGWKGCTARPYLHRHFPGFDYYLWIDADTWIQDETGLDQLIHTAEQQGCGFLSESTLCQGHAFMNALSKESRSALTDKQIWPNGLFCASAKFMNYYAKNSEHNIQSMQKYVWGFDMIIFTYTVYDFVKNPQSIYNYLDLRKSGEHQPIILLEGDNKFAGYHSVDLGRLRRALVPLININPLEVEDIIAVYARQFNVKTESPFFREFPA